MCSMSLSRSPNYKVKMVRDTSPKDRFYGLIGDAQDKGLGRKNLG